MAIKMYKRLKIKPGEKRPDCERLYAA